MGQLEDAAFALADELEQPDRNGVILISDNGDTSVFTTKIDSDLTASVAASIDRNPQLIQLFADALYLVNLMGENRADPGFRRILFTREGTQ